MKKNKVKKSIVLNSLMIIFWSFLLLLVYLMLLSNAVARANEENFFKFIMAFILVTILFSLGIIINLRNLIVEVKYRGNKKFNTLSFTFQIFFIFACFVSIIEAGLDSKTTSEQVKDLINFVVDLKPEIKAKSLEIKINNEKDVYEIGDEISYTPIFKPKRTTYKNLLYEIDNEIVSIDLINNKIKCIKNGTCNITFYLSSNNDIKYNVSLSINTVLLEEIDLGDNKDIFLNVGDEFNLNPVIYPSNAENVSIHYKSNDEKVAVVDEFGKIKALSKGTAEIVCYSGDIESKVYVSVNPVLNMEVKVDTLKLISNKTTGVTMYLYIDEVASFNKKYLTIDIDSKYDIRILYSKAYEAEGYITYTVKNYDSEKNIDEYANVTLTYKYPGGFELVDSLTLKISSGNDLSVTEIDRNKTKTNVDVNLYYFDDQLLTTFVSSQIFYKVSIKDKKINGFKIESDSNVDFTYSSYDNIVMTFNDQNNILDQYIVKYYPTTEEDNYLEVVFNINKCNLKEEDLDSSFNLEYLYEDSENKKNEIWPSYFTEKIFESVNFNDDRMKYLGLHIEPIGDTLDYIDFEVSEFGIIKTLRLKNLKLNCICPEATLKFEICSTYDYKKDINCKKYLYTINIVNEYDDFLLSINNGEYLNQDQEITVLKGSTVNFKYKQVVDLEFKGKFQTNFTRSIVSASISNKDVINSVSASSFKASDYGTCVITFALSKTAVNNTFPINITVNVVDENGVIPVKKYIDLNVLSNPSNLLPNIDKKIFSTGTKLNLSLSDSEEYIWTLSNSKVVSINTFSEDNISNSCEVLCLEPGSATVIATNVNDPNEVYVCTINVFSEVKNVEILKGNFISLTKNNNKYVISVKQNISYLFNYTDDNSVIKYVVTSKNKEDFKLGENNTFIVTKPGTYTGYIQFGEDDSPYMYKLSFTITCGSTNYSQNFMYFIRKFIGHFGLFLSIGLFGILMLLFYKTYKPHKIYLDIINVICIILYGVFTAYITEYIQGLDPTRTNSLKDVMIDSLGYISGVLIPLIIYIFVIFFIKLRNLKKISNEDINDTYEK